VASKYYLGMNVLNYKQYDAGNINPEYAAYLQSNKKSFGVPDWVNYVADNQKMYYDFNVDLASSTKSSLERIINLGLKTLIYNGQNDFIVNTPGVLAVLNTLQWPYTQQWKARPKKMWK
jgi:carboxypeptidase C (cathepsin A)